MPRAESSLNPADFCRAIKERRGFIRANDELILPIRDLEVAFASGRSRLPAD